MQAFLSPVHMVAAAGVLLAMLPSQAPAQRLLQASYASGTAQEPVAAGSDHYAVSKKWKMKKATQDWALAEKLQRQHQHAYPDPVTHYAPAASSHHDDEQESAASYHGGGGGGGGGGPLWGGADESSHDGSRIQFHVQGHKGPKSYRFGYDTGKGPHRHFRYEERDEHGYVHGRYGFHDKHGELHVFHYTAHPHHGYHAHKHQ